MSLRPNVICCLKHLNSFRRIVHSTKYPFDQLYFRPNLIDSVTTQDKFNITLTRHRSIYIVLPTQILADVNLKLMRHRVQFNLADMICILVVKITALIRFILLHMCIGQRCWSKCQTFCRPDVNCRRGLIFKKGRITCYFYIIKIK